MILGILISHRASGRGYDLFGESWQIKRALDGTEIVINICWIFKNELWSNGKYNEGNNTIDASYSSEKYFLNEFRNFMFLKKKRICINK